MKITKKKEKVIDMPYGNSNAITDKEFYAGVARFLDVKPATIKKYWEDGFNEFIIRELYFRGTCRLPHLGTFVLTHEPESAQVQKDAEGKEVTYYVPERDKPKFIPHDDMINDVNMQGVTKKYRKRMKAGQLTQRDYIRQQRADKLGIFGSLTDQRIEASKADFKEMLEQRKAEKEQRNETEDEANEKNG